MLQSASFELPFAGSAIDRENSAMRSAKPDIPCEGLKFLNARLKLPVYDRNLAIADRK